MNVTAGRAVYSSAERPEASGWGVATLLRGIIAKGVKVRGGKGRNLTRRTLYLPALIVAAVLMACAAALLAVSGKAEATFPGKNGKIAYVRDEGNDSEIYTINPGGRGETQLTHDHPENNVPSYSPDGKKIVYSGSSGSGDTEIYTINASGGGKTQLTNNHRDDFFPAYSPGGKK